MNISVVILTKNEAKMISRCLRSVAWADEIIVIDDYSTDNTREIAKKAGARVFKRHLQYNFAAQRNFGLRQASNAWVLFVDADEIVSKQLKSELLQLSPLNCKRHCAYKIRRIDYLWGKWLKHGESGNLKLIRFGRKTAACWQRAVHEYWNIRKGVGELDNPLLHYPHANVAQFIEHIRRYSILHAACLQTDGVQANLGQIFVYPAGKFFLNYFIKLGFLDGSAGFVQAMMMSFHSFLARSQLWLMQHADS